MRGCRCSGIMGIAKPIDQNPIRKEVITLDKLFIGIDVGSRDNAVHIMLPDGEKHRSFSVQNNLGGSQTISKRVASAMVEKELKGLEIGIEATGVYGDGLMCFLNEDGAIGRFEKRLYILNLRGVHSPQLAAKI